ncbi:MAG: hypothetical protein RIS45_1274 [Planctomycetota bacterium]
MTCDCTGVDRTQWHLVGYGSEREYAPGVMGNAGVSRDVGGWSLYVGGECVVRGEVQWQPGQETWQAAERACDEAAKQWTKGA